MPRGCAATEPSMEALSLVKMKFNFMGFPVALLLAAITTSITAQTPPTEGPMVASPKAWKFGSVAQGYKDTKEFEVRNTTRETLSIKKVGVACGCLSASVNHNEIPPDSTITLTVVLDTTRKVGQIKKHVWVETSKGRKLFIDVMGGIRPAWWCDKKTVDLGEVEKGSESSNTFRVLIAKDYKVDIKRITANTGFLSHSIIPLEPDEEGRHGWEVRLKISEAAPLGVFQHHLRISTDFELYPSVMVGVRGRVVGQVVADPDKLVFGVINKGESRDRVLTVRSRTGGGLKIEKVICTDPQIKSEITEKTPGEVFEIKVTMTPTANKRRISGRLFLKTNNASQPMLSIFYHAGIRH